MANTTVQNTDTRTATTGRRLSTETKASFKTSELVAYVVAVLGVLIASAVVDNNPDFGAQEAWQLVTFLTIGYMISRGLAKSDSRDFFDDDATATVVADSSLTHRLIPPVGEAVRLCLLSDGSALI